MPTMDTTDRQGGKKYGQVKAAQDEAINKLNQEILEEELYQDVEDLPDRLNEYKRQFIEFDEDSSGDIDIMELKRMMEKLDQAKTHLELKKMITEVDTTNNGTITYRDFLNMMLGKQNSILKLILLFEEKKKEKERPKGPPPKRSLDTLP